MSLTSRGSIVRAAPRLVGLWLCFLVCDNPYLAERDSITLRAGNAVAHNIAVQTGNPWPSRAADARISIDGERVRIAAERYRANKSIPPRGLATQEVIRLGAPTQ